MTARLWLLIGFFTVPLLACGSAIDPGTGNGNDAGGGPPPVDAPTDPCDGVDPPPECPRECTSDSSCPSGQHCGEDNICTSECTSGGNECGEGQVCNSRGRCVSSTPVGDGGVGNGDGGPDCPSVSVNTTPLVPTVQILIDRSGSMDESPHLGTDEDGNTIFRFEGVRRALIGHTNEAGDKTDGIVEQLQETVRFGASLYTSFNAGSSTPECPILESTDATELNNFDNIVGLFDEFFTRSSLGVHTPTAESIDATVADFPPVEQLGAKRIIILATDGNPDSCENRDDHGPTTRAASENSVAAAHEAGIDVFVLSVGPEVALDHMQRMANLGVGLDPESMGADAAKFYVATEAQQLVESFGEIIRGARSCTFELDGRVTDPTKGSVTMTVDDVDDELEYQTEWDIVTEDGADRSSLVLIDDPDATDDACDRYRNNNIVGLAAEFDCNSVIIID